MRYIILSFLTIFSAGSLWSAAASDAAVGATAGPEDHWKQRTLAAVFTGVPPKKLKFPPLEEGHKDLTHNKDCTHMCVLENPDDPKSALAVIANANSKPVGLYKIAEALGLQSALPGVLPLPKSDKVDAEMEPRVPTTFRYETDRMTDVTGPIELYSDALVEFVRFATPAVQATIPAMAPAIQEIARLVNPHGELSLYDIAVHGKNNGKQYIRDIIMPNLALPDFEALAMVLMLTRLTPNGNRNIMVQLQPTGKFKLVPVDLREAFLPRRSVAHYPSVLFYGPAHLPLSAAAKDKLLALDVSSLEKAFDTYIIPGEMTGAYFAWVIQTIQRLVGTHPDISIHDLYIFSVLLQKPVQAEIRDHRQFMPPPEASRPSTLFLAVAGLSAPKIQEVVGDIPDYNDLKGNPRNPDLDGVNLFARKVEKLLAAGEHAAEGLYAHCRDYFNAWVPALKPAVGP